MENIMKYEELDNDLKIGLKILHFGADMDLLRVIRGKKMMNKGGVNIEIPVINGDVPLIIKEAYFDITKELNEKNYKVDVNDEKKSEELFEFLKDYGVNEVYDEKGEGEDYIELHYDLREKEGKREFLKRYRNSGRIYLKLYRFEGFLKMKVIEKIEKESFVIDKGGVRFKNGSEDFFGRELEFYKREGEWLFREVK